MKNAIAIVVIVLMGVLIWPCFAQQTRPLQVFPQAKNAGPAPSERQRADRLYRLTSRENPRLSWDGCLATQAFMRAKRMGAAHYFDHEDPKTGKNPVWDVVKLCVPSESSGPRQPKTCQKASIRLKIFTGSSWKAPPTGKTSLTGASTTLVWVALIKSA